MGFARLVSIYFHLSFPYIWREAPKTTSGRFFPHPPLCAKTSEAAPRGEHQIQMLMPQVFLGRFSPNLACILFAPVRATGAEHRHRRCLSTLRLVREPALLPNFLLTCVNNLSLCNETYGVRSSVHPSGVRSSQT